MDDFSYTAENIAGVNYLTLTGVAGHARANTVLPSAAIYGGVLCSVVAIADGAFQALSALVNVTIPNSITNVGQYAFFGCLNLQYISFIDGPNHVHIGHQAIGNTPIKKLVLPNSITSIDIGAFVVNLDLQNVFIGSGLTSIPIQAFYWPGSGSGSYNNPKDVYFSGDAPVFELNAGAGELLPAFWPSAVLHYASGTSGWTNPYRGYATAPWDGLPVSSSSQSSELSNS